MKILFTADWHIKLGQKSVPVEWQKNRYKLFFSKLKELQKQCDIMIIGGDIFDRLPTLEELQLYFSFLSYITIPTIIYDGNHEATKKGKSFLPLLSDASYNINDYINILCEPTTINGIDFIPYTHIKSFNPKDFNSKILCTHVRGEIQPHVKPEIDLDKLNSWEVVLAGDLHAYTNCQRNILYPGSPLSTSFHRSKIKNGIIIFDTDTMEHNWIDLELPQLIRKTVVSKDEIIPTEYDHTIYEIEGNTKDLANIDKDDELLDKKIIQKSTESTLNFKGTKTIRDEVILYLTKFLILKQEDVDNIMEIYDDRTRKIDLE